MCLAEFERFAIPNMFLEGTIRKSRRGDNNLPRDTYHVLTICIAVVSTNKQNSLLSLCLAVIRMTRANQDRTQALGLRVKRITMTVTDLGIWMLTNDAHSSNADSPISSTESGRVTLSKE